MENTEEQEQISKDLAKFRKIESIGRFLDKFCIWCEVGAMALCLCSGSWIPALIWFNCILWNIRVVKDNKRLQEANAIIAMLSHVLYSIKKDEKNSSNEVIDVESKEVD